MTIVYSPTANEFFNTLIDPDKIPKDASAVAQSTYANFLKAIKAGKTIVPDDHGNPSIAGNTSPTPVTCTTKNSTPLPLLVKPLSRNSPDAPRVKTFPPVRRGPRLTFRPVKK